MIYLQPLREIALFYSVLYKIGTENAACQTMPAFFTDLHLDQVIDKITEGKKEYNLGPFFYSCLKDQPSILYRQQVMKDLECEKVRASIETFAEAIRQMRTMLKRSAGCPYLYQRERLFLEAFIIYSDSVQQLHRQMQVLPLASEGLISFEQFLSTYTCSETFLRRVQEGEEILVGLQKVRYDLHTNGLTVRVLPYEPEADYTDQTEQLYSRFRAADAKNYLKDFPFATDINRLEAEILKGVASLYPELFQALCDFYNRYPVFSDDTILSFEREIQFYIACLSYCDKIRAHGPLFCYPEVGSVVGSVYAHQTFDIALAHKLAAQGQMPVYNDFVLTDKERILIVSGPNQGGKTTFARTFGQLHYLACLGCPVPGKQARVLLFDNIYTHFERQEELATHRSKLEDDLVRIHGILQAASGRSVIILNEIFSSTTLQDALFLSRKIMQHLTGLNCYCVWVTFVDELVSLSGTTVSMVATVAAENPASRTFKILRKAPDGMAYALSIAEKYHLTYKELKARIKP